MSKNEYHSHILCAMDLFQSNSVVKLSKGGQVTSKD